jgi:hypothetical protein
MAQTSITQLIINSPYEEPQRHWRYDPEGRTFHLVEGRRPAGYVMATPHSRDFDDPGIFIEIPLVNQIRPRVKKWPEAVRGEIDEELIEAYRGTVSLPFEVGKHRRIAAKIVDVRGIESLKVLHIK